MAYTYLFSVVIPTFNRLELLKQAIGSVMAQAFGDYEIIVVDDGSSDGTINYCETLGGRVKVLCQTNKGPAAARNFGVTRVQGQYSRS